jgi:hypothetical protein
MTQKNDTTKHAVPSNRKPTFETWNDSIIAHMKKYAGCEHLEKRKEIRSAFINANELFPVSIVYIDEVYIFENAIECWSKMRNQEQFVLRINSEELEIYEKK